MDDYRAERARVKGMADHYGAVMEGHWRNIRDKEFRSELTTSAIGDLISNVRPLRVARSMIGQEQGILGNLLATFLASKAKGFKGKLLAWVAATAGPMLFDRFLHSEWLDRWVERTKGELEEEEEVELDNGDPAEFPS